MSKRIANSKSTDQQHFVRPRVKLWFELDADRAFCPGVARILAAVESTGSLKEAAVAIGRSYRFVWGKIKDAEEALGCSLVDTRVGGSQVQRSVLTNMGRMLLQEFEVMRRRLHELIDSEFAPRLRQEIERLRQSS